MILYFKSLLVIGYSISDFGFEISDLPADSLAFQSEIVHPKSEIHLNPKLLQLSDLNAPEHDLISVILQ